MWSLALVRRWYVVCKSLIFSCSLRVMASKFLQLLEDRDPSQPPSLARSGRTDLPAIEDPWTVENKILIMICGSNISAPHAQQLTSVSFYLRVKGSFHFAEWAQSLQVRKVGIYLKQCRWLGKDYSPQTTLLSVSATWLDSCSKNRIWDEHSLRNNHFSSSRHFRPQC